MTKWFAMVAMVVGLGACGAGADLTTGQHAAALSSSSASDARSAVYGEDGELLYYSIDRGGDTHRDACFDECFVECPKAGPAAVAAPGALNTARRSAAAAAGKVARAAASCRPSNTRLPLSAFKLSFFLPSAFYLPLRSPATCGVRSLPEQNFLALLNEPQQTPQTPPRAASSWRLDCSSCPRA